MNYNEIGKTGMRVSNLSFGASSLGGVFHDIREAEGIKAVYTAVENGMNFIDVSPYYGHYKAETVLGKALKEIPRDNIISLPKWDAMEKMESTHGIIPENVQRKVCMKAWTDSTLNISI